MIDLGKLLPELYLREDETGDLRALLNILAPTLDEICEKISTLPQLSSVDECPADFLPFLAGLVGVVYDPILSPEPQRRAIREAIELYRRLGTLDGLRRDLLAAGWSGEIIETHRFVLRLGTRGKLNRQKLPGDHDNLGTYGITGVQPGAAISEIIDRHHPAGARRWTEE